MALTPKKLAFIDEYFKCHMNATEAYMNIYPDSSYDAARANSTRLIASDSIKAEINRRLTEKHMGADEVLSRLADMARSDIATFAKVDDLSDLESEEFKGKTHVIKKLKKKISRDKSGTTYTEFELDLYDAQSALVTIGKQHGLFADKHIIETKVEAELDSILTTLEEELTPDDFQRVVNRLTSGKAGGSQMATEDTTD